MAGDANCAPWNEAQLSALGGQRGGEGGAEGREGEGGGRGEWRLLDLQLCRTIGSIADGCIDLVCGVPLTEGGCGEGAEREQQQKGGDEEGEAETGQG